MKVIIFVFFILFGFVQAQENLYSLLGVGQDATSQQIKKAFRKLSIKFHPDRNTEDENAQEKYLSIKRAYEVLIDVSKRNTYDLFGEEGLSQIQKRPKPKGGDYRPSMNVPLAKFYQGGEMVFSFRRGEICKRCKGTGDESGVLKDCPVCSGSGKMTRTVKVKDTVKEMQINCKQCHGTGKAGHNKCPVCKGEKIVMRPRDLKFDVEKGMVDGDKVMFKGQSEQGFQFYPGDVIVTLKQDQHNLFKRDRNDLKISVPITLKEAILGFERNIKHLDNRNLEIVGDYNIQDGQIITIQGEGMPIRGQETYGDLIAEVQVKFPKSYTSEQLEQLKAIFAATPSLSDL